jgi:hypothetical protein
MTALTTAGDLPKPEFAQISFQVFAQLEGIAVPFGGNCHF